MAVRIRLSRFGRLHRPFFRIVAIDQRCHREGVANEILGTYDPLAAADNIKVDVAKVQAWVVKGALISDSLGNLFKHHGIAIPAKTAPKRIVKAKAKTKKAPAKAAAKKADGKAAWVAPSRRAVRKHAAKLKAERKAKAAAEAAAKAPAEGAAAEAPKA